MKQIPEMASPSTAPSNTATSVPSAGSTHAPMWKKWACEAIASDPHLQPAAKYQVKESTTHLAVKQFKLEINGWPYWNR